jgi:2-(3-amino-3-carboxypropyl)histidine synthase
MKILLQFPEGLKKEASKHATKLKDDGHEVFLSGSACYGACDLALSQAKEINADKIVHFGHSRFIRCKLPVDVEYWEYHVDADMEAFKKAIEKLKNHQKIALGTTVQHIHQIDVMKKILKDSGFTVLTAKGKKTGHEAQILGCDAGAVTSIDDADAILIVCDGLFHPLASKSEIPVFQVQPNTGQLREISKELDASWKKRRGAMISASSAESFAILLSTKPGQMNIKGALLAKERLEEIGKSADIVVSDEIDPDSLLNFGVFEAYINTACPRIADDTKRFSRPIVNVGQLDELIDLMKEVR